MPAGALKNTFTGKLSVLVFQTMLTSSRDLLLQRLTLRLYGRDLIHAGPRNRPLSQALAGREQQQL